MPRPTAKRTTGRIQRRHRSIADRSDRRASLRDRLGWRLRWGRPIGLALSQRRLSMVSDRGDGVGNDLRISVSPSVHLHLMSTRSARLPTGQREAGPPLHRLRRIRTRADRSTAALESGSWPVNLSLVRRTFSRRSVSHHVEPRQGRVAAPSETGRADGGLLGWSRLRRSAVVRLGSRSDARPDGTAQPTPRSDRRGFGVVQHQYSVGKASTGVLRPAAAAHAPTVAPADLGYAEARPDSTMTAPPQSRPAAAGTGTVDIDRLTESVVAAIDRRLIAYRERMGGR